MFLKLRNNLNCLGFPSVFDDMRGENGTKLKALVPCTFSRPGAVRREGKGEKPKENPWIFFDAIRQNEQTVSRVLSRMTIYLGLQ